MKLLHLDSSITGDASVSRKLTAQIVAHLQENEDVAYTYRDLTADPLEHLTLAAGGSTSILDEFLAADVVVVGAPMYNFSVPSQLKAWIDRILVAGKTFSYSETGVVGLVGDKRVIVAIARGGFYGPDAAAASSEHLQTYLSAVFGFIGVEAQFIVAEGVMVGPEHRQSAIDSAAETIRSLAA
ncbi:FMN-dependent NADH-azoreductase [Sphingobium sp.]|uniref:FMN-dependent NADH-azoreductase n=1 Tax=Sphingobium sp. TaxID=1912891 RepID=UPI003B3B3F2D